MITTPPDYPGVVAAHRVIHVNYDDNAKGLGDRLVVGACRLAGRHSRVCEARMEGANPLRLRLVVRKVGGGFYFVSGRILEGR